ncbi:hypothetical protein M378DRAFT_538548 [Amanita muscaria Koide BX008]|uniref:F-box domain-containing protein n=1 Tax=Amanita muscaria (strain Koide BX008) TaxID=946122 RepID=A0A0C2SQ02_AMAMK|nr:hypothetical protein M378DRAFT_538548 [Amanita muscaria Koide BX008]
MELSANARGGDELRKSHILELPMELLLHIRDQLLDDSDVTPGELRSLRLVCKSFNVILAPVVMTNMILFPSPLFSQSRHDVIHHLHCLVHHKCNTTTYTTLTIRNWHRLDLGIDHLTTGVRQVWQGPKIWRFWAFFYIVPAIFIILFFLVMDYLVHPRIIPRHVKAIFGTIRARYYITLLPRKLDLPNVRVVSVRERLGNIPFDENTFVGSSTANRVGTGYLI